jgi:hypothetical protein
LNHFEPGLKPERAYMKLELYKLEHISGLYGCRVRRVSIRGIVLALRKLVECVSGSQAHTAYEQHQDLVSVFHIRVPLRNYLHAERVAWYLPVLSALIKQRQEDWKFEAGLNCTVRPCLKIFFTCVCLPFLVVINWNICFRLILQSEYITFK